MPGAVRTPEELVTSLGRAETQLPAARRVSRLVPVRRPRAWLERIGRADADDPLALPDYLYALDPVRGAAHRAVPDVRARQVAGELGATLPDPRAAPDPRDSRGGCQSCPASPAAQSGRSLTRACHIRVLESAAPRLPECL